MKVIFLGTPDFAVPTLKNLIKHHEVLAVVTQPDKPVGRSGKLMPSPVKIEALNHGIQVFQFEKIKRDGVEPLKALNADIMVTCAYGQILNEEILNLTPYGVFNVHGSLLPKYRGASPIQWAVINGEKETGITILKSGIGIDDGPMVYSKSLEILEDETAGELFDRLSILGAECIIEALKRIESGNFELIPQNEDKATHCKMFKADFGKLDFSRSAEELVNFIRGLNPSPVAYFILNGARYKIFKAKVAPKDFLDNFGVHFKELKNGEIALARVKQGLFIKVNDGYLSVLEIQAENSKKMDIKSFLNGKKLEERIIIDNE